MAIASREIPNSTIKLYRQPNMIGQPGLQPERWVQVNLGIA
jgi:hypothetical protein